jgi:alkylation response protein AidB-like acyl-CoA dehydrogenase
VSQLDSLTLTAIPAEDEALRAEVRAFIHAAVKDIPAHIRARSWAGYSADFSRQLGNKGWLGLTLPKAYGGARAQLPLRATCWPRSCSMQAPPSARTGLPTARAAPLILKYGTEAQKQFYLPRICNGEAFFCIGMSEPNAGSDLASVRTRAAKTRHRLGRSMVRRSGRPTLQAATS